MSLSLSSDNIVRQTIVVFNICILTTMNNKNLFLQKFVLLFSFHEAELKYCLCSLTATAKAPRLIRKPVVEEEN